MRCAPVLVLVAVCGLPARLWAQPQSQPADSKEESRTSAEPSAEVKRKAADLFSEGATLARHNRWRDALQAFEQSALLMPHATTSYNMGYCERGLGRLTRARKQFRNALAQDEASGGKELSSELRTGTTSYLREIEETLVRVEVTVSPSDARLSVDGAPLELEGGEGGHWLAVVGTRAAASPESVPAPSFEMLLSPGAHVLVIEAADGRREVIQRHISANTSQLELALPPVPPASTPVPATTPPSPPVMPSSVPAPPTGRFELPPAEEPRGGWPAGTVIAGGFGLVAFAIAGAVGGKALASYDDAEELCPTHQGCSEAALSLRNRAELEANVSNAALAVGGASAVLALVLYFVDEAWTGDAEPSEAGLRLSRTGVTWRRMGIVISTNLSSL